MTFNSDDNPFTGLELDILRMVVGNMSDREIAFALDLAESAVIQINESIFSKLAVKDRTSAIDLAVKLELVKIDL